jgi:hypothetical protein
VTHSCHLTHKVRPSFVIKIAGMTVTTPFPYTHSRMSCVIVPAKPDFAVLADFACWPGWVLRSVVNVVLCISFQKPAEK